MAVTGPAAGQESSVERQLQNASEAEARGDWPAAEKAYSSVLELQPERTDIMVRLGLVYQYQGRLDPAVDAIRSALTLNSDLPDAHFYLGLAYFGLHRYPEAAGALQEAISRDPENVKAQVYLGVCFLALGRVEESIGHLEALTRVHPRELEALQTLAQAYLTKGSDDDFNRTIARIDEAAADDLLEEFFPQLDRAVPQHGLVGTLGSSSRPRSVPPLLVPFVTKRSRSL